MFKNSNWDIIDEEKLQRFIGLCLTMDIVNLLRPRHYYSTRKSIWSYSDRRKSYVEYALKRFFTTCILSTTTTTVKEQIVQISDFIGLLHSSFQIVFHPRKEVHHAIVNKKKRFIFLFNLFYRFWCRDHGMTYNII